jgi:16S rRNA (cytosine967-C5)-methyltransferase
MFEVQDASSQLVAYFLDVAPGMRVVDTCAGAGGKTLHLASLMENKGQLIATDIYESKLR